MGFLHAAAGNAGHGGISVRLVNNRHCLLNAYGAEK